MVLSGDGLSDLLERAPGADNICPRCRWSFSYQDGLGAAFGKGIDEKKDGKQIVLCPRCFSAFKAEFDFAGGLKLVEDVTDQYPQVEVNTKPILKAKQLMENAKPTFNTCRNPIAGCVT